jgi:hypothetical protein
LAAAVVVVVLLQQLLATIPLVEVAVVVDMPKRFYGLPTLPILQPSQLVPEVVVAPQLEVLQAVEVLHPSELSSWLQEDLLEGHSQTVHLC